MNNYLAAKKVLGKNLISVHDGKETINKLLVITSSDYYINYY